MKTGLLIIGDEILNGTTQDTNSGFAARLLNDNGLPVVNVLTIRDNKEEIISGLEYLFSKVDLIISTGGLGPTQDDVTKDTLVSYFNSEFVFNEQVYEYLKARYEKRNMPLNKLNKSQAMVPAIAQVFMNPVGTAPVFWIEKEGKVLITLPGVPNEMRFLLQNVILQPIRNFFNQVPIVQRNILVVGIAESSLAIQLEDIEKEIEEKTNEDTFAKLAYLPNLNQIKLQLTFRGGNELLLKHLSDYFVDKISTRIKEYVFGYDQDIFPAYIGNLLKERDATLSTAESCTGGYLGHLITSVTGSSAYYTGGLISYSNEVKMHDLGVKEHTLNEYGAVSEETLREMLDGCLEKFGSDYAIAVTGLAGPTGDSENKPIGTVWVGAASKYEQVVKKYNWDRNRLENIHLSAIVALDMLRRLILGLDV